MEYLDNIVKLYAINREGYKEQVATYSKDFFAIAFEDLLDMYFGDKNSSTLREKVTALVAGYEHCDEKLGYDAVLYNDGEILRKAEIKPTCIILEDNKKLNGSGNFSDMTFERWRKHSESNFYMLISGFVSGMLMYIVEFPFNYDKFLNNGYDLLSRKFTEEGRRPGEFLRNMSFSYKQYEYCPDIVMKYLRNDIEAYRNKFTKGFYELVMEKNGIL